MRRLSVLFLLGVGALASLAACAGSSSNVCDPVTIEVTGRCYWDQQSACDAANCNAPNKCTIDESVKPAHVECERVDAQK